MPDVIESTRRFKAGLAAQEAEALNRVIETYRTLYNRLQADIDALRLKLEALETPSVAQVRKLEQYTRLIRDIEDELARYTGWYQVELSSRARLAIAQAVRDAEELVRISAGTNAITARWRTLNPEVIEQLIGFLSPESELYNRLRSTAGYTAKQIADGILEGVARGYNPVKTANVILKGLGVPLTNAIRTMRTVQLWSYREANRASYLANPEVVTGWVWLAELDTETCGSCIAQHGTVHGMDETLDDHYNGRCTMYPLTITSPNVDIQTGEDWFKGLPEAQQEQILGADRYEAWKDGKFELSQLSHQVENDTYGTMRVEATLSELVGDDV